MCNPQSKKRIKQGMKVNELKLLDNSVVVYIYVLFAIARHPTILKVN